MADKSFFGGFMADNLQQVLALLQQSGKALSSSAIRTQLPIAERTLSRLLKQLTEAGQIQAIGYKRGRVYQSITPVTLAPNALPNTIPSLFSKLALEAIEQVRKPLIYRQPCTYNKTWLDAYQPNQTFYLSEPDRQLLWQCGKPSNIELPAGTYARKIFNRLLIDLSYNSSRLEGNTYSLVDTEKLLLNGIAATDKLDAEKIMLLNHKEAIRFLVDGIKRMEINSDNIRSLHFLLSDGLVLPQDAGKIRQDSVRVSSSTYIPMDNPERLSKQLEQIIQKAQAINDPFEQSFFLLVHLSYLQAFIDVNKRTARLACNIPLVRHNLIPLSFNDMDKDDYLSAVLVVYEQNQTRPLAELYIGSYLRSCKQYEVTAEAIGIDILRVQYRQFRRDLIRQIVQQNLHGTALENLIHTHIQQHIPAEHREKCLQDLRFDLEHLAVWNIVGMGISGKELEVWLRK